ncbi:Putative adhesin [Streptosporangium subroseum]|uniref:Putative adhesin n=2 Tax=Streptosporangium subroseum TaxID=106412 RepID=A0A239JPR1_9ACTN|nr:Putative adhesin [Streptosporangium subroseum]
MRRAGVLGHSGITPLRRGIGTEKEAESFPKLRTELMKKTMLAAGALLGSALVLSGCRLDVGAFGDEEQAVSSYDVTGTVTALDVSTGSGEIVINESKRSGVHVTETMHWRGDKPKAEHPLDADKLTLRYKCPEPDGNCSVDYKVEIPQGVTVKLDAGSGIITLRGLTGGVSASTGSGDIEANALGAKRFVADTGSGHIKARFTVMPDNVDLETGSGDVTAWLPQGAYNVTTRSGSGDQTVEVTKDPSAPRTVSVQTGSGDAEVLLP